MLDPWIIEEIRRREDERRREREACRIQLPLHDDEERSSFDPSPKPEESQRGVVVIDI